MAYKQGMHPNSRNGFKKGHKPIVSYDTIQKHKEAMSGKRNHSYGKFGKDSYGWKDDKDCITPENKRIRESIEYRLWREAVFARDNFTCQKYGTIGGKLRSHHIQNFTQYPELRFAINNGITLSEKAHKEFHKIYGFKNNTKEQLIKYLKGNKHE